MAKSEKGRRVVLPILATVVGLGAIGVGEDIPTRHSIEHKLTNASVDALHQAGIDETGVTFVGRDGTVRVTSAVDADRARSVVEDVTGVRVARVIVPLGSGPTNPIVTPSNPPSVTITATPAPSGVVAPPSGAPTDAAGVPTAPPASAGASGAPSAPAGGGAPNASTPPPAPPASTPPSSPPSALPAPSAPAPSATVSAVQTQISKLGEIKFAFGSSALTAQDRSIVTEVAAILAKNPGVHIQIQGNTDSSGPASVNLALSKLRAKAVYNALRGLGVAADRMTVVAYGETRPKVPNTSSVNRATNRRVDIVATD